MKGIIAFCFALITVIGVKAQVTNTGFENWTGNPPAESLTGWWTLNQLAPLGAVTKSTDSHSGTYAVKAQPKSSGPQTLPGIIALNDMTNDATLNGIPYTSRPDTLKVWTKFTVAGADQLYVLAILTKWDATGDSAIVVGGGGGISSVAQASYIQFVAPFEYETSDTPDSMQIIMAIGDLDVPTGDTNSVAYFDDLEIIDNGTPVKVQDIILGAKVNIYPNPSNGSFNIEIPADLENAVLTVYDINGKVVFTENVNSGLMNLNTNSVSGKYFVKIQNEKHTVNKSIIIE